ncbi:hypothetical protein TNCV_4894611 [Trichonephila clavipes]|nr:hypothetical protein TNCV_4894611 [Trichonephila clavipes]
MTHFRIIVNGLQPPEIIDLHTDSEKRIVELLTKVLPHHHPLDIPCFRAFASFEPKDVSSDYLEQEASKGKGAFIQALYTLYAKSKLYSVAYKAWKRHGPQNLTTWTLLAQAVLDGCYGEKWPDTVFQVPDVCLICLSPMHWPEKTLCGHVFHLRCLLQLLDTSRLDRCKPSKAVSEPQALTGRNAELSRLTCSMEGFYHFSTTWWYIYGAWGKRKFKNDSYSLKLVLISVILTTMNYPVVFNLSSSTHDGTLVSLEPVKMTQRDPRRRRLPQVFFPTQG